MEDRRGESNHILGLVRAGWGFTGLVPSRVLDVNEFGNLLIEDASGRIWRICPEELSCAPVLAAAQELDDLILSDDWKMERLVAIATAKLGIPGEGRCFCLKVPAVLGGRYSADNFALIDAGDGGDRRWDPFELSHE